MRHNISDIRFLTQSIFEISDGLDNSAKCILDEIRKVTEKPVSHSKSDITKKKTEEAKEVRMAGSFLNRKSSTILMLKPLPNINHQNNLSKKTDKNAPEPEPDSQVNIFIVYFILHVFLHLLCNVFYIFNFVYRITCT